MTLGEQLIAARQRAGLSVDQITATTRIRLGLLEAMEANDFSRCGGNFYARGHLRTLAGVLGADPNEWVAQFDAEHAAAEESQSRRLQTMEPKPPQVNGARPRWAILLGVVLVGLMGWGMVRVFTLPDDVEATASGATPTPSVTVTATVSPIPVRPRPKPSPKPTPKPTSVRITLVADHEGTYVTMRNYYGKVLFSGLLTRGGQQTLTYRGQIRVTVGIPRNLRTYVNGKRVYPKSRRFTAMLDGSIEKRP